MVFTLWIIAGVLLVIGAFIMVVGVVSLERRLAEAQARRLRSYLYEASGMMVSVPGRGWVPADGRFTGR